MIRKRYYGPTQEPSKPGGTTGRDESTGAYFLVLEPNQSYRRVEISQPVMTIGRLPSNSLPLDHEDVSRVHAEVSRRGAEYVIEDKKSRNGVRVNGKLIERSRPRRLRDGDCLKISEVTLFFFDPQQRARTQTVGLANIAIDQGKVDEEVEKLLTKFGAIRNVRAP
jgi:pSer/pThr/pTyr-binding forkhead associated (FHA) protein